MKERVLIVEDNSEQRMLLSKIFKDKYELDFASNGLNALEKLNTSLYDLVISDMRMPEMDGVELLKEIKIRFLALPVIMMTGYGKIEDAVETMKMGAYNYVTKPFNVDELEMIVERCLSESKKNLELNILKQCIPLYELLSCGPEAPDINKFPLLILETACEITSSNSGSILLLNEKGNVLEMVASLGLRDDIDRKIPMGERISGRVCSEGKAIILHSGLKEYEEFKAHIKRDEIISSMIIPLYAYGKVIGVLTLNRFSSFPYRFTENEKRSMEFFVSQISAIMIQIEILKKSNEMEKIKFEFLGNVSHELRTPLMSMMGAIEIIKEADHDQSETRLIDLIVRNAKRLDRLVVDLLDFSKMDSVQLKYRFVNSNIVACVKESVADLSGEISAKRIQLKTDYPENIPDINIDPYRIKQVITNLVSNACKFTPESGKLRISVYEQDENIVIQVKDNGVGISDFEKKRIFNRFYQADGSSTRNAGGVGLGLTISKDIIEAHNGKIWVESEAGSGSKFFVSLRKKK